MNIAAPGVMMGAGGEFLSQATRLDALHHKILH